MFVSMMSGKAQKFRDMKKAAFAIGQRVSVRGKETQRVIPINAKNKYGMESRNLIMGVASDIEPHDASAGIISAGIAARWRLREHGAAGRCDLNRLSE